MVVGVLDPNPHVRGGGVDALQKAGIQVVTGVSQAAAHALAAPWLKHITLGLPYVSLKLALTLDGRIATRSGASKWVTGPEARAKVHALRSSHDAVAVGVGTVVADDPRLTVRDSPGTSPVRVVFDTTLRLPLDGQLVASAREIPLVVLCSLDASPKAEAELQSHGAVVLRAPESTAGRVDIESALRLLGERGIVSMMVEGGAELAGQLPRRATRGRAPRVHRAVAVRSARSARRGRLEGPRDPHRGAPHHAARVGVLRRRRLRARPRRLPRRRVVRRA